MVLAHGEEIFRYEGQGIEGKTKNDSRRSIKSRPWRPPTSSKITTKQHRYRQLQSEMEPLSSFTKTEVVLPANYPRETRMSTRHPSDKLSIVGNLFESSYGGDNGISVLMSHANGFVKVGPLQISDQTDTYRKCTNPSWRTCIKSSRTSME